MTEYLDTSFRGWSGKWIWGEKESTNNSYCYFRKEFDLEDSKGKLMLHITADTRYKLFINGKYIHYGPIQSQPYCTYFDSYEITQYVKGGVNAIGIIVFYGGHLEATRGGLLAEIVNEDDAVVEATGSTWKAKRASAWEEKTYSQRYNRYAPYQEFFDASKEPEGWCEAGFNDSRWENAFVITGPGGRELPPSVEPWSIIRKRDIPYMTETPVNMESICKIEECLHIENRFRKEDLSISLSQPGSNIRFAGVQGIDLLLKGLGPAAVQCAMDGEFGGVYNPTFIVDFGKVITAFFEIELEGAKGQYVEIGYAERLVDGYFNNALECQFADKYTLKSGRQTFRSFNWRGYRYVKLVFKNCFDPLKIHSIKGIVSTFPFEEKGGFHSSDAKLNAVFDICKYSIRLCSNESILDTPWREQSQWVGDSAAVTMGGIYSCFGDARLPGKFIHQSSCNQLQTGFITNITNAFESYESKYIKSMIDYNLWWVISVWHHYMYTGEEKWIHEYYPVIAKMMLNLFQYVDRYGMLSHIPYSVFIDWANHDNKGCSTPLNAIFYGTLEVLYNMSEKKADTYMMNRIEEIRGLIKENFMERFYDYGRQVFTDSNYEGQISEKISETANMLSIYFGLSDKQTSSDIVRKFFVTKEVDGYVKANPFMSFFTLKALARLGMYELAVEIINDRWFERMVARGAKSTFEEWSENGSYRDGKFAGFFRSHSHAWSAGPAEFLIKGIGGVEILEPGCSKVSVQPAAVSADYEIKYPVPQGIITIRKKGNDITVELPEGVYC